MNNSDNLKKGLDYVSKIESNVISEFLDLHYRALASYNTVKQVHSTSMIPALFRNESAVSFLPLMSEEGGRRVPFLAGAEMFEFERDLFYCMYKRRTR